MHQYFALPKRITKNALSISLITFSQYQFALATGLEESTREKNITIPKAYCLAQFFLNKKRLILATIKT